VPLFLLCASFSIRSTSVESQHTLFRIDRSRDANQIVYKLNMLDDGSLNQKNPIEAYWLKHSGQGSMEPISWIQRELSYGLKFINVSDNQATFHFAAYNKKNLFLRKIGGVYKVFAFSNDKFVEIDHIFVNFKGGTDWLPTVQFVEIHSKDAANGQAVKEIIYP
jgi:hypothetical protein